MKGFACCASLAVLLLGNAALAGEPWLAPGNIQARHDLEMLVDDGIINIPISEWPISVADLAAAMDAFEHKQAGSLTPATAGAGPAKGPQLTPAQSAAFNRLRKLASPDDTGLFAEARAAARPEELRTFWDEPRAAYEGTVGVAGFLGDRFGGRLELTVVDSPPDGDNFRADGSYLSTILGNWIVSVGAQDKWWGSGWEGSLILSNNSRPVPAISIDRALSTPFETKWLHWLGPWRVKAFLGYMNEVRGDYNHPLLFGARWTARPMEGLEVSLERTAMFCGEGRSCTWSDFWNLWTGHDNAGENVSAKNEPGDQLAGWDIRWASPIGGWPYALYWQHTGESIDNKIPRPYRSFDLYGGEAWGGFESGGSWRLDLEYAQTLCGGTQDGQKLWDCAYNNGIFDAEGYRFKNRVMGHSMDGDGLQYAARFVLVPASETTWSFMVRYTELNRGGQFDNMRNFVAPGPEDWWSVDVMYRRPVPRGWIEIGVGADQEDRLWNDTSAFLPRGTLSWHYGF
jgi:hypothetical protein